MRSPQRYIFTTFDASLGEAGFRPYLPITLSHQNQSLEARGLLDTGATVNVLPYQLGLELGAIWEQLTHPHNENLSKLLKNPEKVKNKKAESF